MVVLSVLDVVPPHDLDLAKVCILLPLKTEPSALVDGPYEVCVRLESLLS